MPTSITARAWCATASSTQLADYLAGFIERLARAGAEAAVLPAVTPHICIAELTPRTAMPADQHRRCRSARSCARASIKRVALFGTTFTVQGSLWGQLAGVEIVKPQPDEIAFIGQAYQRILDTQKADAERRRRPAPHRRRPAAPRRRRGDPARRHRPRRDLRRGDGRLPLPSTSPACTSTRSSRGWRPQLIAQAALRRRLASCPTTAQISARRAARWSGPAA